jgi:hypothetical protein
MPRLAMSSVFSRAPPRDYRQRVRLLGALRQQWQDRVTSAFAHQAHQAFDPGDLLGRGPNRYRHRWALTGIAAASSFDGRSRSL